MRTPARASCLSQFQIAEHALHDDVRSLLAGGASDAARALESADLDGGPGAVGELDTGAALSGGRSVGAQHASTLSRRAQTDGAPVS
jgi:hypothetical protein